MKTKQKGFSLIELLVSSMLILFLIGATAQLLGLALAAKRNADFHFRAARLASSRLEGLKSLSHDSPHLEAGVHEETVNDPSSLETFRRVWRVEDINQNLKKAVLDFHSLNRPQKKAVFCLLLCRELEF
jgi:prepilin-type N-terminal cleavage/methylation domain-containing protein